MSLNNAQRRKTAAEFAQNLGLSGLSREQLGVRCGLEQGRLGAALAVEPGADPVDVWLVRDALESAVVDRGDSPVRYTVLTEQMRAAAGMWFGVRDRR